MRTALVTGASSGIGRAIARKLALNGVRVVGAARRTSLIDDLSREVVALGAPAIESLACDLAVPGSPADLARNALESFGQVDILMNVAGESRPAGVEDPPSRWAEAMTLGFLSHLELTHALLPQMRARRWGRIVSVTGVSEPRFLSASSPAKAALHMWSKAVSREVAGDGVTMNCIQPGRIRSEQIARRYPTPELERAYAEKEIPMKRLGEADELATAAAFLASDEASYVTGIVMPVDGGFKYYAY
jgi:3-oxoacyl-[acyl-carrier protein] reductase